MFRLSKEYLGKCGCQKLDGSLRDIDTNSFRVRWRKGRCTDLHVLCTIHIRRHRDRTCYQELACSRTGNCTGTNPKCWHNSAGIGGPFRCIRQCLHRYLTLQNHCLWIEIRRHYQRMNEGLLPIGILPCSRNGKSRVCWRIANSASRSLRKTCWVQVIIFSRFFFCFNIINLSSESCTFVDIFAFAIRSDCVAWLTSADVASRTILTQLISLAVVSWFGTFVDI